LHYTVSFFFCVSILILLEVPLQPDTKGFPPVVGQSFNPYFTGSTTSTFLTSSEPHILSGFQSLFYWKYHFNPAFINWVLSMYLVSILILLEVPLQHVAVGLYMTSSIMFQSLFYWKYHFNSTYLAPPTRLPPGFNPYFTGSTTSTKNRRNDAKRNTRFQSLFYWKYHFNYRHGKPFARYKAVSILILLEVPLQPKRFWRVGKK